MDGLCCCASRHKTPEAEMLFDDPIGSPAGKKKKDSSPNRVMDGYVKFDNVAEEDPVPQVAPAPPPRTGKVVIDIEVTTATPKREVLDIEVTVDSAGGAGENVASSGVLTGSVHAAVTGGASTFTAALRSALGVDGGAHDAAVSTASSGTFDAAVEEELRALFRRCDRDKNGIMGRAEFSRALQILKLEKHLGLIGKSSGLLGGIEKLFSDLASGGNGVDEEHFVKLFRQLAEDERAELSSRASVAPSGKGKPRLPPRGGRASSLARKDDAEKEGRDGELQGALSTLKKISSEGA